MELDKRIKALTDIQSVTDGCHDWEFMTKKGYFANSIFDFQDLSKCEYGEYVDYREHDKCFHCEVILPDGTTDYNWFSYFLPEDSLLPEEKPEKKYRPFSLNEFLNQYHLGDEIIVRRKLNKDRSIHKLFTEYGGNDDTVHLGTYWFTFKDLYDNYEIFKDGEWKPFGILVENE